MTKTFVSMFAYIAYVSYMCFEIYIDNIKVTLEPKPFKTQMTNDT